MKVGIVAQRDNHRAVALAEELAGRLAEADVAVVLDRSTTDAIGDGGWAGEGPTGVPVDAMGAQDLVVSIGGDGTFLYAARGADTTPVMGVNLGEVGFLNAVPPDQAVDAVMSEVAEFREGGDVRTRDMARLVASGEDWTLAPALNEVLVQGPRRGHGGGAGVEVRVDGSVYTSGHADGVLVATPTGSTAYNLSEGGPLVHPAVDGLVVTEMAGREPMPPLVVDESSEVTIRLEASAAIAVSDGRARQTLEPPTQVTVATADDPVRIAGPPRDFFAALGKLE